MAAPMTPRQRSEAIVHLAADENDPFDSITLVARILVTMITTGAPRLNLEPEVLLESVVALMAKDFAFLQARKSGQAG